MRRQDEGAVTHDGAEDSPVPTSQAPRGRRGPAFLAGLAALTALAALSGASLLAHPASAVVTPVVMTNVCVNSAQGQMSYPVGGTCAAGQASYPVNDPAQILKTCYLQSNGAIRKVSSSSDCVNAPRSKKENFLEVPSLTTDLYFCADSASGALFFKGTSPANCPAKQFLVVVKQANHPPVANGQSVSLNEDATKLITLTGSDPDAQPITFKITALPANGELFKGNSTAAADKITSVPTTIPSSGTSADVTYKPFADYFGTDPFQFKTNDSFTDSAAGVVSISVNAVNDAPSFNTLAGNPPAVNEDVTAQTVNGFATGMTPGPANESGQGLTFVIVSNTNAALFNGMAGQPLVNAATGNLTYAPAPNANGSALITIKLMDGGGTLNGGDDDSATQQFTITVNAVNDAPSFQLPASPDQTVLEDSPAHTVATFATAISPGPADEAGQTLTFHVSNGNNALFSVQPDIDETTGALTYTLAANANGSATVSVFLSDNGGTANGGSDASATQSFQILVTAVNDEPSFDLSASPNQTVEEDSGPQTVSAFATNILAGPADESGQALTFHTSSDNLALFATQPAIDPASGDLTYEPAPGQTGTATVSVYLTDDGGTANGGDDTSSTKTFTITIFPPNATPVADGQTGANTVAATEDTPKTITLSASDADDDDLSFSIVSGPSHGSLGSIGAPNCAPVNTCTATVEYTPAANYAGSDSFTFKANDGTADSNTATVDIDVAPVNDAPSFTKGADETVLEDSGAHPVDNWATAISPGGGADEAGQTVTFTVTNNTNPALFSVAPAVGSDGTLTYTPAADAFGSATITLKAVDNGTPPAESPPQSFVISVTGVNDAPSFTKGANQTVDEDAGAQSVPDWATGISAGPNESGQTVTFAITNNTNPGLFSAAPAVSPTGTLTYTPAANQHGTATITLKITDNGGTANGGVDESSTQSFGITVTAVNDPPTSSGRAYGANSLETNMKRSIDAASGLLVGVADAADVAGNGSWAPTITVGTVNGVAPSGGTITTTIAGVGTVVADAATGAFTIDPAPGVTGNVSFNFTVCDNGDGTPASACSSTATASFDISGPVIWFVNPAAGSNGSGTLASPFNVLASADAVDAANHRVFVYSGSTTTGLSLNSGEWLVGQGVTGTTFDTLMGISPPTGTLARPTLAGARPTIGGGLALNTDALVRGLNVTPGSGVAALTDSGHSGVAVSEAAATGTNAAAVDLNGTGGSVTLSAATSAGSAGSGIALTNVTASFTGAAGSVTNATGADVAISGGNGAFTYEGSISDDVGTLVSVSGATGGTKSFNGSLTDLNNGTGNGVSLTGNTGATVNFTGGLILSTGTNPAFTATGGGTVSTTGSPSTLTTTTGTALNVTNTNIGSSGLTFLSISSNGAANGIVLNGTGASGGLTVTGNSSGGCGTSATEADCTGGTIQNTTGDGISLTSTASPSFTRINLKNDKGSGIRAVTVSGLTVSNSLIQGSADTGGQTEAGLFMTNISGTSSLASSTVKNSFENNVQWNASSGTGTLNVTSSTIGPTTGNSGVQMIGTATGVATLNVTGSTFAGNNAAGIGTSFANSSAHTVNVSTSAFTDNNMAVALGTVDDADVTFDIHDNATILRSKTNAIQVLAGATSTANSHVVGKIRNNTIGDTNVDSGARDLIGIAIEFNDDADGVIDVTNNTIRHTDQDGIFIQARDPNTGDGNPATATVDLHVRDNSVQSIDDNTAFPFGAVYGTRIESRHDTTLCLDLFSNTSAHVGPDTDFRVRQRDASVFKLERLLDNDGTPNGINTNASNVAAFVAAQNDAGSTADATLALGFTVANDGACRDVP
jgi:hypothetical protein